MCRCAGERSEGAPFSSSLSCIFDVIDDKCQNITIDAGDIIRVFSYISKDAIGLTPRKPKEKDVKEIFGSNILNQSVHSAERNNEGSLKSDLTLQTKNEVASVEEPVIIPVPVTLVTSKEDTKTEEAKKDEDMAKMGIASLVISAIGWGIKQYMGKQKEQQAEGGTKCIRKQYYTDFASILN